MGQGQSRPLTQEELQHIATEAYPKTLRIEQLRDRVLAITELRETVFKQLPEVDIVVAMRTERLWKTSIDGSPSLQRKLFYQLETSDRIAGTALRVNRIFFEHGVDTMIVPQFAPDGTTLVNCVRADMNMNAGRFFIHTDHDIQVPPSYTNMMVVKPPRHMILVEWDCLGISVPPYGWPAKFKAWVNNINEKGVNMGQVAAVCALPINKLRYYGLMNDSECRIWIPANSYFLPGLSSDPPKDNTVTVAIEGPYKDEQGIIRCLTPDSCHRTDDELDSEDDEGEEDDEAEQPEDEQAEDPAESDDVASEFLEEEGTGDVDNTNNFVDSDENADGQAWDAEDRQGSAGRPIDEFDEEELEGPAKRRKM